MAELKRFLIAVNGTEASTKALNYFGALFGPAKDIECILLNIYPSPPPHYYQSGKSLHDYQQEKEKGAQAIFQESEDILLQQGISPEIIKTKCVMAEDKTISQVILDSREEEDCGAIVVGKRGVSKAEEFLFGSISSNLIHQNANFAVWVVG